MASAARKLQNALKQILVYFNLEQKYHHYVISRTRYNNILHYAKVRNTADYFLLDYAQVLHYAAQLCYEFTLSA